MKVSRNWIPWTIIILIVAGGYFQNARTNIKLTNTQHSMLTQSNCTINYLSKTVQVLNERTTATPELNEADKVKTQAEARLFGFVTRLGASTEQPSQHVIDQYNKLIHNYFDGITKYLNTLGRQDINQQVNPFPTATDYRACLRNGGQNARDRR